MDVNVKIPAIEKLIDYAASGIGSVAGPMLAPWKARREAQAALIAAKGDADVKQALAEGRAATMTIISEAQARARLMLLPSDASIRGQIDLAETVSQRIQFQEEKRQSNIMNVIDQAAHELGDREVQDHEVDHDWTARFFNDVQDVSSEEMQELWAKILAGEVQQPRNTSLRTLRILKDLDPSTAMLFRTLCSARLAFQIGIVGGYAENLGAEIVLSLGGNASHNALEQFGLNYNILNVLNEYGLIIPEYDSSIRHEFSTHVSEADGSLQSISFAFRFQGRSWILIPAYQRQGKQSVELGGVILSISGMELARFVAPEPMPEYEKAVVDFLQQNNLRMVEVDPNTLEPL